MNWQKGNTNTILIVIVIIIVLIGGYWLANRDNNMNNVPEENNGIDVNIGGTFPAGSGQEGGAAE